MNFFTLTINGEHGLNMQDSCTGCFVSPSQNLHAPVRFLDLEDCHHHVLLDAMYVETKKKTLNKKNYHDDVLFG